MVLESSDRLIFVTHMVKIHQSTQCFSWGQDRQVYDALTLQCSSFSSDEVGVSTCSARKFPSQVGTRVPRVPVCRVSKQEPRRLTWCTQRGDGQHTTEQESPDPCHLLGWNDGRPDLTAYLYITSMSSGGSKVNQPGQSGSVAVSDALRHMAEQMSADNALSCLHRAHEQFSGFHFPCSSLFSEVNYMHLFLCRTTLYCLHITQKNAFNSTKITFSIMHLPVQWWRLIEIAIG